MAAPAEGRRPPPGAGHRRQRRRRAARGPAPGSVRRDPRQQRAPQPSAAVPSAPCWWSASASAATTTSATPAMICGSGPPPARPSACGSAGLQRQAARLAAPGAGLPGHRRRRPRAWLRALRLHQWLKNLLVFLPLLMAHQFGDRHRLAGAAIGFAAFCLCASGVYLLNDLVDLLPTGATSAKRRGLSPPAPCRRRRACWPRCCCWRRRSRWPPASVCGCWRCCCSTIC